MQRANLFAAPERLKRLQIEITTGCNLRCVGCQRTIGMADRSWRNAHMRVERFAAIIRNAPPAEAIILQGIGEPTLHPDLAEMIGLAKQTGKFGVVSFNTNALVRSLEEYAELRARGLGHVSISVDSLVPETAEAARSGTDCEKLRQAIAGLTKLFPRAVTLSIVLSQLNLGGLGSLLLELHELGGRFVEIQPLISYTADNDKLCLGDEHFVRARTIIAETKAKAPDLQIILASVMTPNGTRCRRPFTAAYVTVEGLLTPCCTTNDTSLFRRTSLVDMPFVEAWRSEGVSRWLQDYFDKEPEICHGCPYNPSGAGRAPEKPAVPPSLAEGQRLHQAGQIDAAEKTFLSLIGGDSHAEALHRLGLIKFQRGDAAGALPLLQAANALSPNARCAHNIASILHSQGRKDEAIALERRNLAEHPEYVGSYISLAAMLAETGDPGGAASILILLGKRAAKDPDPKLAALAVSRLVVLDADHPDLLSLANMLRAAGREELAQALLRRILMRSSENMATGRA